ncbi:MAG: DUF2158 domain-containing protein [Pseudomonadota bacterium]
MEGLMNLREGDIVVLRSGGPKMTVASVKQDRAFCVWFNQRDQFHEERTGEFLVSTLNVLRPKPRTSANENARERSSVETPSVEPTQPGMVEADPVAEKAP